jgi:hypothetical protein
MTTHDLYTSPTDGPGWEVPLAGDTRFSWEYDDGRDRLLSLYQKGKDKQWDAVKRIDWEIEVDPYDVLGLPEQSLAIYGTPYWDKMSPDNIRELKRHLASWQFSQFMHGEQGAMITGARIVETVPDLDAKFYSATQTMDEARHVEVYDRYLHEKIKVLYPISPYLKTLLDLILKDSRWDMKLLGMQIMVEGLALASFGMIRQNTKEPLLQRLTHYVMLDEARHVAYGVLALRHYYDDMKESERREREDFIYESAVLMRDRFLFQQVWEKMGMPVDECVEIATNSPAQQMFRQLLFAKVVPAVKRIGLLSERQRERFDKLGILQFESWSDPFEDLKAADAAAPPA